MKRRSGITFRRRGAVLVAVLIAVTLSVMVAVSLMFRMDAEVAASAAGGGYEQAHAAAMSGIHKATAVLSESLIDMDAWYDDEEAFRNQFVADDGASRWYFTIYAHDPDEPEELRYGLTDEAGKLNINGATEEMLLALPGMTRELAHCLMDFRDRNDEPMEQGAEQEYYAGLAHPYRIKNTLFATVEELLLVKGFDASIVYGEDANLNGLLDGNEDDGDEQFPPDDGDGQLNRGLKGMAAAFTYEPNVDNAGEARININGDLKNLDEAGLSAQTEDFIRLCRGDGIMFSHASKLLNMRYRLRKDASSDVARTASWAGDSSSATAYKAGTWLESGVDAGNLDTVLDRLTTRPSGPRQFQVGLLNVNTAPAEVLAALPDIDTGLASRIVDSRRDLDSQTKATIAWLYAEGVVDEPTFKDIAQRLTARSYQFRIQCIGFGWPSGQFRILEAVVNFGMGRPRITYLRDITRLGLPAAIDIEKELGT